MNVIPNYDTFPLKHSICQVDVLACLGTWRMNPPYT